MKKHFQKNTKRRNSLDDDFSVRTVRSIKIVGSKFEYKRRDKNVNEFSKQYF